MKEGITDLQDRLRRCTIQLTRDPKTKEIESETGEIFEDIRTVLSVKLLENINTWIQEAYLIPSKIKKKKHAHFYRHYVETIEYQRQSDLKTSGKLEFCNQQKYLCGRKYDLRWEI